MFTSLAIGLFGVWLGGNRVVLYIRSSFGSRGLIRRGEADGWFFYFILIFSF